MQIHLISFYELGHQPVHLASPAARLRSEGHQVLVHDFSLESLEVTELGEADAVALSVPMHTAMRLAGPAADRLRTTYPDLPIALFGLYAGVGKDRMLEVADVLLVGEYEQGLVDWLAGIDEGRNPRGLVKTTDVGDFLVPDRSGLPANHEYARLEFGGQSKLAAAVEASHGCRHRCRHCPIPVVYDGRLRVVGADAVLGDISQLAEAGVEHVTFGDPDFLNAPRYSMDILRSAHRRFPDLTFDITVKVEHILRHQALWPEMTDLGLLFVVSAFESVDQITLNILDKNHSVADMSDALELVRGSGTHIRPTWLPFMPWTTLDDMSGLVRFLDEQRLWTATDPVQLSIKLLLPEGSLLEQHPAMVDHLNGYDVDALTWRWAFADPAVEVLHKEIQIIAADASDCGQESLQTLSMMRAAIGRAVNEKFGPILHPGPATPRLTESWFCCSEPTAIQISRMGLGVGSVESHREGTDYGDSHSERAQEDI